MLESLITHAVKGVVPLAALWYAYLGAVYLFRYWQSLYVEAKPNEWLVVMNNGKLVTAGIGIAMNRGPFDTVAVFPSRLVKVDIKAQQITNEYQGLEVSAMIEWTVDKDGDGPMKAYKNLGSDLAGSVPYTANSMLSDMASSILRNQIANLPVKSVIENRQQLRQAVIDTMKVVVKGWGVHLETVEVTDVRILSSTLFTNMQAQFREQNRKTATLQQNQVNNEIDEAQLVEATREFKRNQDNKKVRKLRELADAYEQKKRENAELERSIKLQKTQFQRELDAKYFREKQSADQKQAKLLIDIASNQTVVEKQVQN